MLRYLLVINNNTDNDDELFKHNSLVAKKHYNTYA